MPATKDILVTTTSTLEGWEIEKYIKPVSSHIVTGTNFFSDFFASFTDFFGGRSGTYQNQISSIYNDAIDELKKRAFEIGSNCIIGLSVDMDEISGKGKSMFMITATGTAVIAKQKLRTILPVYDDANLVNISSDRIIILKKRKMIISKAKDETLVLDDNIWNHLITYKVHEVFDYLVKKWKLINQNLELEAFNTFTNKMVEYVGALEEPKKSELVYNVLLNDDVLLLGITKVMRDLQLLNLPTVKTHLQSNDFKKQKRISKALLYEQPYYNREDLNELKEIRNIIEETFKERGQYSTKKVLLSSKEKEVWNCECGHKNNEINQVCEACSNDIYGFNVNETSKKQLLNSIDSKIELIGSCLNSEIENQSV